MSAETVSKIGLAVIVVTMVGLYFYKENYARPKVDLSPMTSKRNPNVPRVVIEKTREERQRENQALAAINPLLAAQPTLDMKAQQMLLSQQIEDKLRRTNIQSNPLDNITLQRELVKQSVDVPIPTLPMVMITQAPTYPPTQAPTYPPTQAPTQAPAYLTQAPTYPPTQAPTYVFIETPTQSPVEVLEDILRITPTPTPMIDVSSLMVSPVYEKDENLWVGQSYEEKFMYVK
jgi:cell division protein FtsN